MAVYAVLEKKEKTGVRGQGSGVRKHDPDASIKPLHINRGFLRKLGLFGKRKRQGIGNRDQGTGNRERGTGTRD
jgi:hypothetical protein